MIRFLAQAGIGTYSGSPPLEDSLYSEFARRLDFSSLRAKDAIAPILNLEQGRSVTGSGRMIFYVADVDAFWEYLRGKGFNPEKPRDASWGERYFHMSDPDGHELSFACPI